MRTSATTSMNALEQALMGFFKDVAAKDEQTLAALKHEPRFNVANSHWCFRLHDLFEFLQHHDDFLGEATYTEFRRAIYNSPVNASLRPLGAQIVIDANRGYIEESVYAMAWDARAVQDADRQT